METSNNLLAKQTNHIKNVSQRETNNVCWMYIVIAIEIWVLFLLLYIGLV